MTLHDVILILHVLGAGVIIGIGFLALAIAFRKPLDPEKIARLQWVGSFGLGATVLQLITGLYLSWSDWDTLHNSKIFWTKMGLFVLQGAVAGGLIGRKVKEAGQGKGSPLTVLLAHSLMILIIVSLGVMMVEHF